MGAPIPATAMCTHTQIGASALDASMLSGKVLLNLDSEDHGVIYIGCAGAGESAITLTAATEPLGAASGEMVAQTVRGCSKRSQPGICSRATVADKLMLGRVCKTLIPAANLPLPANAQLSVTGLAGGHSGLQISQGLANAVQLMAGAVLEVLAAAPGTKLVELRGGTRGPLPQTRRG